MYPIVYSGKWKTDLLHLHILQLHHLYWQTLIIYLLYRSSVTSVQWILQPRQLHRFSNSLQENKRTYLPLFVFCPQKLRDRAKTSDCPVIPPPRHTIHLSITWFATAHFRTGSPRDIDEFYLACVLVSYLRARAAVLSNCVQIVLLCNNCSHLSELQSGFAAISLLYCVRFLFVCSLRNITKK